MRDAKLTRIFIIAWTFKPNNRMHWMGHVFRRLMSRFLDADVDVNEGAGVTRKPTRLH